MVVRAEFEFKVSLPDDFRLEPVLHRCDFLGEVFQNDEYFDYTDRGLFARGVFVRVRNRKKFAVKFTPFEDAVGHHLSCLEASCELDADPSSVGSVDQFLARAAGREESGVVTVDQLFEAYGLVPFVQIEKTRRSFSCPGARLSIDAVKRLGRFLEIEIQDRQCLDYYRTFLDQHHLRHIETGYVELLLRKEDYPTYLMGRHVLQEDL